MRGEAILRNRTTQRKRKKVEAEPCRNTQHLAPEGHARRVHWERAIRCKLGAQAECRILPESPVDDPHDRQHSNGCAARRAHGDEYLRRRPFEAQRTSREEEIEAQYATNVLIVSLRYVDETATFRCAADLYQYIRTERAR